MAFLTAQFYENEIWRWFLALGIIVFVWIAMRILVRFIVRRLRAFAARTPGHFDDLVVDLLGKTRLVFVVVFSLYAGSLVVKLPEQADWVLRTAFVLALLLQAGYWGNAFVAFWINRTVHKKLEEDASTATSMAALGFVARLAIWTIVVLLALDNMGLDITTLIAGLGIGGIAIALAVQNILADLFASLSILVDKPFVIGDFIIVGENAGTVEKIGLKTTRVRSLSGEQIVFSNGDLLSSRVRNYKRMYERRIAFTVGVTYDTPAEKVERIPEMVRSIIDSQPNARFDRSHFKAFGDFALSIETVYYLLVPDYNVYMDTQQAINLGMMRAFEDAGIEFAYPTQTLYVSRLDPLENE